MPYSTTRPGADLHAFFIAFATAKRSHLDGDLRSLARRAKVNSAAGCTARETSVDRFSFDLRDPRWNRPV